MLSFKNVVQAFHPSTSTWRNVSPVDWDCRIHWLYFFDGEAPITHRSTRSVWHFNWMQTKQLGTITSVYKPYIYIYIYILYLALKILHFDLSQSAKYYTVILLIVWLDYFKKLFKYFKDLSGRDDEFAPTGFRLNYNSKMMS